MNERIRELADKARFTDKIPYPSQDQVFEKFAELIIRECVNQALEEKVSEEWIDKEDNIEDQCYLRGINGGIVDAVIRIKQHFGIKE
jgi:hypothetical protein